MTKRTAPKPRSGPTDVEIAAIEARKRGSSMQLLFRASRRMNELALARASQAFGFPVRAAHTSLLPHIAFAGTRQTDLAAKLGVSKQAVHKLVDELCGLGLLERIPDPADARATLVRFSAPGRASMMRGLGVLEALEKEALSTADAAALHAILTRLEAWLDEHPAT